MSSENRGWYIFGAVLFAGLLFQFFFRYQYVHLAGNVVMRIDRITGTSCNEPCADPEPKKEVTPPSQSSVDAEIVNHMINAHSVDHPPSSGYKWVIINHYDESGNPQPALASGESSTDVEGDYTVREVCFCDKKNSGWWFEVKPNTFGDTEMEIVGNSVLEKKYGIVSKS
jgi:hypothetical protein